MCLFLLFSSCTPQEDTAELAKQQGKLYIVTTTGILQDAVANVAGERAVVEALMGSGVDPHLYKAALGDLQKLRQADVIIYNGLHLEGKMGEVLEKLSRQQTVWAAAEGLPKNKLRHSPNYPDTHDPHVWFDVQLWSKLVAHVSERLQKHDPAHAQEYRQNTQKYLQQLDSLHQWAKQQIASIPAQQRILITAHDAFGYFGDAYNIEVRGLQGISTMSEFGLRDVSSLVDFITKRKIKAVFVETSVSNKAIEAVQEGSKQRGQQVKIGGNLYSDALGEAGGPAGTYIGMVKANVQKIVEALK